MYISDKRAPQGEVIFDGISSLQLRLDIIMCAWYTFVMVILL